MTARTASTSLVLALIASSATGLAQSTRGLEIGAEVPPLVGVDLDGEALTWERWPDRAVVVFFHSTSGRWSNQMLEEVVEQFADDAELRDRAAILVVTNDASATAALRATVEGSRVPFGITVAEDRKGYQKYHAIAFPTAFTIGVDRKVVHATRGRSPLFAMRVHVATRLATGLIDREQFDAALAPVAPPETGDSKVQRTLKLAERLVARNLHDQGRTILTQKLEQVPDHPDLLAHLALLELDAGRADEATAWIVRFEEHTTERRTARVLRARLHLLRDEPDLAEAQLRGLPIKSTGMALLKGQVLERLERHAEAAAVYRKALERVLRESAGR